MDFVMSDSRTSPEGGERLAKVIARSGLCSRRDAEAWIAAGRVGVNGRIVRTPAFNVTTRDAVTVDGNPLAERQGTRLWLYHKPAGLVVTEKDPEGRSTVFEALEARGLPRVLSVGRLDINTEGLLLLTNDGGLKRVLELPSTGWMRRYRVRAHGSVTQAALDNLADGIEVDGVNYGPIEATLEREQGANVWLVMGLREGKNREIKNVLEALGLTVNRLIRVSYGPFQLGDLPPGEVEVIRARVLRDQLGKKLAEEAGVDFDSPLPETGASERQPVRSPRDRVRPAARGRDERPTARGRDERPTAGARFARDERPAPTRRIHFEDGESVEFERPAPRGRDQDAGSRPSRDRADAPRGRPSRAGQDADRPQRPPRRDDRRTEDGRPDRPPRRPRAEGADAGPRPFRGARPTGDARPARGPRKFDSAERPAGRGRPAHDGDAPRRPRAEGAGAGPRPPRGPRPTGDARPARAPRKFENAERPAGRARPARDADAAPPRRSARPGAGPAKGRPAGPRPTSGRPGAKNLGAKNPGKPGARPSRPGSGPRPGDKPRGGPGGKGGGRPARPPRKGD
jgi:23S rRNA pseudouridine2605 synthase